MEKIDLLQIAYTSEWALAKFFPAMFEYGLSDYFNLIGVCGREATKDEVRVRLLSEIGNRIEALQQGKTWRIENIIAEIESANNLLKKLARDDIRYFPIGDGNLPDEEYKAGVIHTSNTTHLHYIGALLESGRHVLCEKPLVTLTNEKHEADRTGLNSLEELVKKHCGLIMVDSEHYSAKKATRAFFERIGDMVGKYGRIWKIKGYTSEKDDPEKERTRKLLCRENRTGLLLDMGVHLFGIVTNIEGEIGDILDAEYDIYPGHTGCPPYNVETYVKTRFMVGGNLYWDNAEGEFKFAKFIDKLKEPLDEDNKKVEVTFQQRDESGKPIDTTVVTVDFRKGTVEDDKGKKWYSKSSSHEYMNILQDFYDAILTGQQPRTSFEHSIKNLDAIFRVYTKFPIESRITKVYKR